MFNTSEGGMTAHQLQARLHSVAINATLSPSIEVERYIRRHIDDVTTHQAAREIGLQAMLRAEAHRHP